MPISESRQNPDEITFLLSNTNGPESLWAVIQLAYAELHDIAVHHSRNEKPSRTLQATELVHEACLRLIENARNYKNRRYFFGAASEAMRRILVEAARTRDSKKRGGDLRRVDFSYAERIGFDEPDELLDFDAALTRLEMVNPRWAEVSKLRVFGCLSTPETAAVLVIGESTARRRWALARRWLGGALSNSVSHSDSLQRSRGAV